MEQDNEKKQMGKPTIKIEVPNDIEKGTYSNQIIVSYSQKEFMLDFGLLMPPGNKIKIVSRVITNPMDAKLLMIMLNENISRYEKMFGTINVPMRKGSGHKDQPIH